MSFSNTLLGTSSALVSGATAGLPARGPRQSVWSPAPQLGSTTAGNTSSGAATASGISSNARHITATDIGVRRSTPPQLTWVSVADTLFETRTPSDPSEFVGSAHFAFIAKSLAQGYLPNYRMMGEREFMNVLEVFEPLIASPGLRQALSESVAAQSLGHLAILSSSKADFGGDLGENVVYLALRRHSTRIPFAIAPHGFEQHRRA